MREPPRDPRGGRQRARQARQDDGLPQRPRRLRGDERGLRAPRRRPAAGALHGRGRGAPVRRARRDRGDRAPSRSSRTVGQRAEWRRCGSSVADYVRSLGLDAYVVGGAVRDELLGLPHEDTDFVVPGRRPRRAARRARAARPGRGSRRRRAARRRPALPARPRRRARSRRPGSSSRRRASSARPGPGRHDFEIVADASISLAEDMAPPRLHRQRDRAALETGELLDPLDGRGDLARRVLRTTSPTSFRDDPLRIVRGLRFVSAARLRARRGHAARRCANGRRRSPTSPASGSAAASRPTGWASSRSSCSARSRRGRCGSRATPACSSRSCRSSSPRSASTRRAATTSCRSTSTIFAVVQAAADAGAPLRVRLAALFHDLGKPESAGAATTGACTSTRTRRSASARTRTSAPSSRPRRSGGCATRPRCAAACAGSCAAHVPACRAERRPRARAAVPRPARRGGSRSTCSRTRRPTCEGKGTRAARTRRARAPRPLPRRSSSAEREQPAPRSRDLAVDGDDLIALGYRAGPGARRDARAAAARGRRRPGAEHARVAAGRAERCCAAAS